ncbi:hypothetical protein Ahy_B05g078925 [Arachis hypogaea]|uniref:Uncharacterized protein n=1 Tax=Arachis hypogaea TaxID=3818 RepID=A0A444Z8H9_ARAHY|nr:hypothetical protein Ahy_B05g078925 [Arachis hypogaea]
MNNRVRVVRVAPAYGGNKLGGKKPLPKRGQIKSKIAANAFHSIISVISRAGASSSSAINSRRKS